MQQPGLGAVLIMSSSDFPSAQGGQLFPAPREWRGRTQNPNTAGLCLQQ